MASRRSGSQPLSARTLLERLETHHRPTAEHSAAVAEYAAQLALALTGQPSTAHAARRAGLLHDIGKLQLPLALLEGPPGLTAEQRQALEAHPEAGVALAGRLLAPHEQQAVREHHERLQGIGYPRGVVQPSELARVVAVADSFDALAAARSYHPGVPPGLAARQLLDEAASCGLDRQLTFLLGRLLEDQPTPPRCTDWREQLRRCGFS